MQCQNTKDPSSPEILSHTFFFIADVIIGVEESFKWSFHLRITSTGFTDVRGQAALETWDGWTALKECLVYSTNGITKVFLLQR